MVSMYICHKSPTLFVALNNPHPVLWMPLVNNVYFFVTSPLAKVLLDSGPVYP